MINGSQQLPGEQATEVVQGLGGCLFPVFFICLQGGVRKRSYITQKKCIQPLHAITFCLIAGCFLALLLKLTMAGSIQMIRRHLLVLERCYWLVLPS